MVKIEVSDAGLPSRPSTPNPLHNRRVQRMFGFASILIIITVFTLYQRSSWTGTDLGPANPSQISLGQTNTIEVLNKAAEIFGQAPQEAVAPIKPPKHSDHVPAMTPLHGLDQTRVALIIETRAIAHLPALLLNFISTLPPQWVIKHVGDKPAFDLVKKHEPLRRHIASGKLVLLELPAEYPTRNNEDLSATLTSLTFYRDFLAPAEWLLMFQTDSMICSGSPLSVDDWVDLGYDWVGAPWHPDVPGGNGGFSLRHIPPIVKLLTSTTRVANDEAWEDLWLSERLSNCAPASIEVQFSVESFYHETPLGYHLRGSGKLVDAAIWGNRTRRRQIMNYCPEIKTILGIVSLESQQEEQWRLEDEGKVAPDPKKNFEAIVKSLTDNSDINVVKDDKKEQWTISAKSAEDGNKSEAAQKGSEDSGRKQEGEANQTTSTQATPTATLPMPEGVVSVVPTNVPETVNIDQSSYGEVKKVVGGSSVEQEKAALEAALKADKGKWNGRRRRV